MKAARICIALFVVLALCTSVFAASRHPDFPCFTVPQLPFGGSIGKVNNERVRVKATGGRAGMCNSVVMRREMSFRDHKVSRTDIWRRRLGKVANY
jgi:hypothetical protein